jgi:cytosine/adenosine deaminase-related metal-dependent hydrolase
VSPDLAPETIVRMATVNGARALGLHGKIGELSENAWADLIAVPFGGKESDTYEAVVRHASDVVASMIDGRWALSPAT